MVVGVQAVDVAGVVHAHLGELMVVTYVDVRVRVDKVILEGHTPVYRDGNPDGVEVVAAGGYALRRFGSARYYRVEGVVNDMVRGIYRYVSSLGIAGSKPSQVGLVENGVHLREGRATVIAARHQNFKEGADIVR